MDLKEMLGKKKSLKPEAKESKLKMLGEMRDVASNMMGDGIKGHMDKVTVAAKDPKSMSIGLDQAKKIVDPMQEHNPAIEQAEDDTHEDLDGDHEEGESADHVMQVAEPQDHQNGIDSMVDSLHPHEIDGAIQKLMDKKKAHKA